MHQGAPANCKWSQKVTHTLVHTAAKCVSGLQHHWAPNVRSIAAACIWPPIYSPCNWTRVNAESVWIYCIHLRTLQHNWNLRLPRSWAPNVPESMVSFCLLNVEICVSFVLWYYIWNDCCTMPTNRRVGAQRGLLLLLLFNTIPFFYIIILY